MLASFGFDDLDLARRLQEEYDKEAAVQLTAETDSDISRSSESSSSLCEGNASHSEHSIRTVKLGISPVDPSLEVTDPNPDIRELFLQFNDQFFWGQLSGIEVKWSPRMTLCAGLCVYEGRGGLCSVRLSLPLLKLRPRKDLVETLLHEMIHAFLFVTDHEKDHDDHGPNFKKHMYRINKDTGANISVYHTFHDEVASYQQHWWKCNGPCQKRPPYYGMVKRAMNRPPSQRDPWFSEHQSTCGGTFIKVKEPEGYGQKKGKAKTEKSDKVQNLTTDIRAFVGKGATLGSSSQPGKSLSNDSLKGTNKSKNAEDGQGKGLAVFTNGVLTHKKTPGVIDKRPGGLKQPGKSFSPLFSSIASTSGTSGMKNTNLMSTSKISLTNGLDQPRGPNKINRPFTGSPGMLSRKPVVKGKGTFNDNITLLELFKQRQARENARESGADLKIKQEAIKLAKPVKKESDTANEHESCRDKNEAKRVLVETTSHVKDDDDFVLDLTGPDASDLHSTSQKSCSPKRLSDFKPTNKGKVKKRWKNIFPTLSGKKHRDKFKRSGSSRFPRNFVSVCEGGDYDDVAVIYNQKRPKGKKKKLKYIIDELDSNDDLWNEKESSILTNEENSVEPSRNPNDLNHSRQNNVLEEDLSESDKDSNLSHLNPNPSVLESKQPPINTIHNRSLPSREKFEAAPSTSGLNGHILGRGEIGLSYLAQVRKKLMDERRQNSSDMQSRSSVECSDISGSEDRTSHKRCSDVAFEDDDVHPRAKRRSAIGDEEFIEEQEDRRDVIEEPVPFMVPCPVCTQLVLESNINNHLDGCLI